MPRVAPIGRGSRLLAWPLLLAAVPIAAARHLTPSRPRSPHRASSGPAGGSLSNPQQETAMRFGTDVFADEREAAEALLAAGFIPVGRDGTKHYRHPDRDTDRWVQRADVQQAKGGPSKAQVHVWRAFK